MAPFGELVLTVDHPVLPPATDELLEWPVERDVQRLDQRSETSWDNCQVNLPLLQGSPHCSSEVDTTAVPYQEPSATMVGPLECCFDPRQAAC